MDCEFTNFTSIKRLDLPDLSTLGIKKLLIMAIAMEIKPVTVPKIYITL